MRKLNFDEAFLHTLDHKPLLGAIP